VWLFLAATAVGGSVMTGIETALGAGLARNIGRNHAVSFSLFDDPHVYVPLIGMGLLALLPILISKLRGKKVPSDPMKQ
jgi:hypothetical protein